jgi:hypothetical protein
MGLSPQCATDTAALESLLGGTLDVEMISCRSTVVWRITPTKELEMQYLLLIYANEAEIAGRSASALATMTAEYTEFTKGIVQAGHFKAGDRLRPTSAATTVRVRNGKVVTTDGPFAETREQLGGYYLVEAKNLDEATAIAARIPGAKHGSIEVRPIWPVEA